MLILEQPGFYRQDGTLICPHHDLVVNLEKTAKSYWSAVIHDDTILQNPADSIIRVSESLHQHTYVLVGVFNQNEVVYSIGPSLIDATFVVESIE